MLAKEFATDADADRSMTPETAASSTSTGGNKRRKVTKKQQQQKQPQRAQVLGLGRRPDGTVAKGGILADGVGLGKTYIAAGVIATNPKDRTLIVTLPSTTVQWCKTIFAFIGVTPYSLLSSRLNSLESMPDVIVTTYNCVRMRPPWLMRTAWDRVVLDEGHVVRNPKTATYQALSDLRSEIRWVLSATPIHNGDNDIKTLFKWIGFRSDEIPIGHLIENYMLRRTMESEKHRTSEVDLPPLEVVDVMLDMCPQELEAYRNIERESIKPLEDEAAVKPSTGSADKGAEKKEDKKEEGQRPQGQGRAELDPVTQATTEGEEGGGSKGAEEGRVDEHLQQEEAKKKQQQEVKKQRARNSGALLRRISHLRQMCVSQEVMLRAKQARDRHERVESDFDDDDYDIAEMGMAVSFDDADDAAFAGVSSSREAVENRSTRQQTQQQQTQQQTQQHTQQHTQQVEADMVSRHLDAHNPPPPPPTLSTKMSRLCDMVCEDLARDPSVKIVIFTAFLSEMDILFRELGRRTIGCTRIHGGLSPLQRSPQIQMFGCPDSGINVLLAQIMCMSTGVNLQAASVAYITSPSWNPCIEEQAIGRLHRQGQTRPVTVRRLIMRESVETRCLDIQKRKMEIIRKNIKRSLESSAEEREARANEYKRVETTASEKAAAAAAMAALDTRYVDVAPPASPTRDPGSGSGCVSSDADAHIKSVLDRLAADREKTRQDEREQDALDVLQLSSKEMQQLVGGQ